VRPPLVDLSADGATPFGYGLRVPGLAISAWARPGYIDHSLLSFDSYTVLIENLFMGGTGLDPAALGIPDHRPDLRDRLTTVQLPDGSTAPLGNLLDEFDFTQTPIKPVVLSTHIPPGIMVACRGSATDHRQHCTQPAVTVTWNAVSGPQVPGPMTYHLVRDGVAVARCVTQATSCVDMPGVGTHYYRVYSVDPSGDVSPLSAASEADVFK